MNTKQKGTNTMKQAKYILLSLAALTGLAACSSDSDFAPSSRSEGNAVVVKASVGKAGIFTRTNPAGTDKEQAKFNDGDVISLTDGQKTVNYTLSGTTWNPTAGEYLTWHSTSVDFKAYYPLSVNGATNSYAVGNVATDQSSDANLAASDYMTATATAAKETNDHTLDLTFERKTARIVVNIAGYNNQFYGLHASVGAVTINGKIATDGTASGGINPYMVKPDQYVALVCPAEGNDADDFISIVVNHDDVGSAAHHSLVSKGHPKFEAGKSYTFNLTVGKDKLTIEDVTVEDWATGAAITGGEAMDAGYFGLKVTSEDLGKVVTTTGQLYSSVAEAQAEGKDPVAMIAYVGDDTGDGTYNHGLAIALKSARTNNKDFDMDCGSGIYEVRVDWVKDINVALSNYNVDRPQYSGDWRLPSVKDLKHIFASFGGDNYTDEMPTSGQKGNPGVFATKMEECGGDVFPPLSKYDDGQGFLYTTDSDSKHNSWGFCINNTRRDYGWQLGITYSSIRPVFAF